MTMRTNYANSSGMVRPRESGQAGIFLVLILGMFLLGGIGLAVDMANMWFHRQAAQNAADAACTAAAMDMVNDASSASNSGGFTPGTAFNCSSNSTASPCQYAAFNGYTATTGGLQTNSPSVDIAISFPSSASGVKSCSGTTPPPSVCTETGFPTNAFVNATVTDRTQSFFVGLLAGRTTMDVPGTATCAAVLSNSPIPLLVLNPTVDNALNMSGNPEISVYGGPPRSVQVNSSSASGASSNGKGPNLFVDLSQGGPNLNGSYFGVTGGPTSACCNLTPAQNWTYPAAPLSDPFALIPAPAIPSNVPASAASNGGGAPPTSPCPNTTTNTYSGFTGCVEYAPGYYAHGINPSGTAMFDPGIYYVVGGLNSSSNSCWYPSTATGDGSGGTMFYFADSNSISVGNNFGKPNKCPFAFPTCAGNGVILPSNCGTGSLAYGVGCKASSSVPQNLPTTMIGTILLGPCQKPTVTALCTPNCSINYGDPLGTNDPGGEQRGMLFFQNRSTASAANGDWSGGGLFLLSGNIYIHQCVAANVSDTGVGCSTSGTTSTSVAYNDNMNFGGTSGAGSFVVGDVVVDKLSMSGTPGIAFDLNPNSVYYVLKASLIQ